MQTTTEKTPLIITCEHMMSAKAGMLVLRSFGFRGWKQDRGDCYISPTNKISNKDFYQKLVDQGWKADEVQQSSDNSYSAKRWIHCPDNTYHIRFFWFNPDEPARQLVMYNTNQVDPMHRPYDGSSDYIYKPL